MVNYGKVGNSQHFPTNLHILLDESEKANHSHIVSWCSQGQSFKIHDQDALVPLLAKYFRQTKFKSFLRQLQSYSFRRTTRGSEKGTVSHPLFVRGRRSLCFRMSRKVAGGSAAEKISQIPRSASTTENIVFRENTKITDRFIPITREISASMLASETCMQSNDGSEQLRMKNETFRVQTDSQQDVRPIHYDQMARFISKTNSAVQPMSRSLTTNIVYPPNNPGEAAIPRESSACDSVVMICEKQNNAVKCTEIDYRVDSSPANVSVPRESYVLSVKNSSPDAFAATNPVLSQQQVMYEVQECQLPPRLLPIHHVPLSHGSLNKDQTQKFEYQQGRKVHPHQACLQVQAQQEQQERSKPLEIKVQQKKFPYRQEEKLYSHQEVVEQMKRAVEEVAKHYNRKRQEKLQAILQQQREQLLHRHQNMEREGVLSKSSTTFSPDFTDEPNLIDLKTSDPFDLTFSTAEFHGIPSDSNKMTHRPGVGHSTHPTHPQVAQTVLPIISHRQEQLQQHAGCAVSVDPLDNLGTSIDDDNMECPLQNGIEGCDEWDMKEEEFEAGLNYYDFLNIE